MIVMNMLNWDVIEQMNIERLVVTLAVSYHIFASI